MKITLVGAGSTVFTKNVLGDTLMCEAFHDVEIALYDISEKRLGESKLVIDKLNAAINQGRATVKTYLGEENRKDALRDADFVICTVRVGGYEPCTVIDFEIPKKYGLRQTIGDTLGIGGIFRALRTIPVLRAVAEDMEEVCPNAWLLNYTNPMAMLTGYIQRYTKVKTIGLCHSVQVCVPNLLKELDMEDVDPDKLQYTIAGINHMAWLLNVQDQKGNDLYPELRRRAKEKNAAEKHGDMVRFDYMDKLGYYCTESSEHNAEYNAFYIKPNRPDLIEKFNIPLDEYLRRCVRQAERWENQWKELSADGAVVEHSRSIEYAARIMNAVATNTPYTIGANVLNNGIISNLPAEACVEVPCLVDGNGIRPCFIGNLPTQLAAMNASNIYPQMLTIEAAHERSMEKVYQAAMMDPHTGAELSTDEIVSLCDELFAAHTGAGFPIF